MDKSKQISDTRWAFLFPGQGTQYPGMGRDFYETFSIAKQTFQEADALLGKKFSSKIFDGPADELILTKNSQVAIFIVSIAILRVVQEQFPALNPFVCAGLSLGEYTALTASNKMSFAECLELVRVRAEAMHEACELKKGTMRVVLGLNERTVAEVIQTLCPLSVWIANLNCPEQVVIAGAQEDIELAIVALKEKGAKRVLPLEVSGAFHSGFMKSAQEKLASKITDAPLRQSLVELVMNVPGDFVKELSEIRRCLFEQVVSPVRWEKAIRSMIDHSIDIFLEMGPGKSLNGMNKRIGVGGVSLSIEKVTDLEQLSKYAGECDATIAKC